MPHHPRRLALYCLGAVVPAAGLIVATGVGASAATTSAATARPSAAASAQALALARQEIKKLDIGHHPANLKNHGKISGLTQSSDSNWAGYADTGSNYSQVSANWTEPSGTCSGTAAQLAAFWVGIDGYSNSSVEQDGTVIECYQGTAYQYTWWEMYPTNAMQIVGQTLAPGDQISSTVTRSGDSYTLAVTDATNPANSFSTTQTCSDCGNASAEWIAEAPSDGSTIEPLAQFSPWSVSGAGVADGGSPGTISSFTDDEITMVGSSGADKATTGALSGDGSGFGVTWDSAS